MKMNQCLGMGIVEDNGLLVSLGSKIIASDPLTKQPMSTAFRVVLIAYPDVDKCPGLGGYNFSVHTQYFEVLISENSDLVEKCNKCPRNWIESGHYYDTLPEAMMKFGDLIKNNSECAGSIYRDLE